MMLSGFINGRWQESLASKQFLILCEKKEKLLTEMAKMALWTEILQ